MTERDEENNITNVAVALATYKNIKITPIDTEQRGITQEQNTRRYEIISNLRDDTDLEEKWAQNKASTGAEEAANGATKQSTNSTKEQLWCTPLD